MGTAAVRRLCARAAWHGAVVTGRRPRLGRLKRRKWVRPSRARPAGDSRRALRAASCQLRRGSRVGAAPALPVRPRTTAGSGPPASRCRPRQRRDRPQLKLPARRLRQLAARRLAGSVPPGAAVLAVTPAGAPRRGRPGPSAARSRQSSPRHPDRCTHRPGREPGQKVDESASKVNESTAVTVGTEI